MRRRHVPLTNWYVRTRSFVENRYGAAIPPTPNHHRLTETSARGTIRPSVAVQCNATDNVNDDRTIATESECLPTIALYRIL